jgi:hypothetical protein
MAEPKKRIPHWVLVCSVLLAIVAAVLGFIEAVGRRGTIVGRYHRLAEGNTVTAEEAFRILGKPDDYREVPSISTSPVPPEWRRYFLASNRTKLAAWREGPAELVVAFGPIDFDHPKTWYATGAKTLRVSGPGFGWWHVRRWAEQTWTLINGTLR